MSFAVVQRRVGETVVTGNDISWDRVKRQANLVGSVDAESCSD